MPAKHIVHKYIQYIDIIITNMQMITASWIVFYQHCDETKTFEDPSLLQFLQAIYCRQNLWTTSYTTWVRIQVQVLSMLLRSPLIVYFLIGSFYCTSTQDVSSNTILLHVSTSSDAGVQHSLYRLLMMMLAPLVPPSQTPNSLYDHTLTRCGCIESRGGVPVEWVLAHAREFFACSWQ